MSSQDCIRFAGYAAIFDARDASGDIIRRGAFAKTLKDRTTGLPLLWQHRPDTMIGTIDTIDEDLRGLRVIAKLTDTGSWAAAMLVKGIIDGLSFGYRAREFDRKQATRELFEIDLFEVSLVSHPLQHAARVHLVV